METAHSMSPQGFAHPPAGSFRRVLCDALGYWEPRRIVYNLVLLATTMAWLIATWPHFRPAIALSSLPPLLFLAFAANVCYCAAYLVDIPMQSSLASAAWKRRRWVLWLAGLLIAVVLTNYWIADEIYPYVH
jgi:hypothetical protein